MLDRELGELVAQRGIARVPRRRERGELLADVGPNPRLREHGVLRHDHSQPLLHRLRTLGVERDDQRLRGFFDLRVDQHRVAGLYTTQHRGPDPLPTGDPNRRGRSGGPHEPERNFLGRARSIDHHPRLR